MNGSFVLQELLGIPGVHTSGSASTASVHSLQSAWSCPIALAAPWAEAVLGYLCPVGCNGRDEHSPYSPVLCFRKHA